MVIMKRVKIICILFWFESRLHSIYNALTRYQSQLFDAQQSLYSIKGSYESNHINDISPCAVQIF